MEPGGDFYTLAECAKRLRVTKVTVRAWIKHGHLPAARTPGGRYIIKVKDVDEFLDARPVQPLSAIAAV